MTTADPGLDIRALQGIRQTRRDLSMIRRRIRQHVDHHEGYIAFSGGKDSLVSLHLTLAVAPNQPVVFFDGGLEFPETYQYLEQLTELWHLELHVIPTAQTTLQVLAAGGGWSHDVPDDADAPNLHRVAIVEPAAAAHRIHGPGEIWGVRAAESRGRAAAYANALRAAACFCEPRCDNQNRRRLHGGLITRVDGTVAYGPVWDWKDAEIWGYIARHHLPTNPVYEKLRKLGAPAEFLRVSGMLDASRLTEGRVTWLKRGWPSLFDELAEALPRIREFV